MNFPDVIVLNGTSSSGKTSLAIALQETLEESYMHLSIDAILGTLPQRAFTPDVIVQTVHRGMAGFHRCIAALASTGNKVIVDIVFENKEWAEECILLLQPYNALFVGVHCLLEELERREQARGNRTIGMARRQLNHVHLRIQYDIEVNTLENTPEQCAEQIKQHLLNHT